MLPGSCFYCRGPLSPNNQCLCHQCIQDLPWLTSSCNQCATPMHSQGTCGNCQRKPPPFRRCISAFHYQPPIDRLVKRLKRDINSPELIQLSGFLADLISASYGTNIPLLVIPLPLHWTRLARRGFNQSHSIAAQLQQRLSHL
ncbi:double zinc ribbon domain-containing protein, partial [bacterium]|nr:double zinc ribbon domain-containing protein [bacterium]